MNKLKIVLIIFTALLFGGYFGFWYYVDHEENGAPRMSVYDYGTTSIKAAKNGSGKAFFIVEFITHCKKFPVDYREFSETDIYVDESCKYKKFVPDETQVDINSPVYPWNDPWGRPYQIRYDRERRKLQVRSQGRYLWTEFDDIVGETSMAIPIDMADAERAKCDSVPKDDMSCIFNRGWH